MRKRTKSMEEQLNLRMRAEVQRYLVMSEEDYHDFCDVVGIKPRTFFNRQKDPGSFRLDELRRFVRHYNVDAVTLCALFGVDPRSANH